MTLFDDLGADVPTRGVPERVVSLVPALTEAIEATVPGRLVGVTDYCTHPAGLAVTRVGGSKYPKIDRVLALRPDLVLANSEENRPEDVEILRGNGFPVWVMRAPATVPHALASLRRLLAQALETVEPRWLVEAEELWRETVPAWTRAVVPVWRKPWVILGRDTFGGDVLQRLGVSIVYGDYPERYPRPKLDELRSWFASGMADLLVLPDEPYEFTHEDGPDAFPGVRYALVSGRYLTWYGPSLLVAHQELSAALER
ncbi:helical backbone metal receptor [Amycolatopsis taiwanensis]|uniref:ABC transporter substrate-binding protein n=1 Tax=Amycolatopsis taiwanensis TaxID=342230 RepID=A0A9W6R689_9PSEU|nr:helical backbone metal receptor [Amycolatopsis taiwanensis]GLY68215.1 ABC transporter substrate-binding protein [Amycolatopsis taiwanensis]